MANSSAGVSEMDEIDRILNELQRKDFYDAVKEIEKLGASDDFTASVVAVGKLSEHLGSVITDRAKTRAAIDNYVKRQVLEARIDARERLLDKLTRTYRKIMKPIEQSPMELTQEAENYNRFVEDLYKFIDIERNKNVAASLRASHDGKEG